MNPRHPQSPADRRASQKFIPGSASCSHPRPYTSLPPQSPPGPHLGVILCLTSSGHVGLFGLISGSFALTFALTQLIPVSPWLPQRADH